MFCRNHSEADMMMRRSLAKRLLSFLILHHMLTELRSEKCIKSSRILYYVLYCFISMCADVINSSPCDIIDDIMF